MEKRNRRLQESSLQQQQQERQQQECSTDYTERPRIIRLAVSETDASVIQPYLDTYKVYQTIQNSDGFVEGGTSGTSGGGGGGDRTSASSRTNSARTSIQLSVVPSIRELQRDAQQDVTSSAGGYYDGFIVPPTIMGDLFAREGLRNISLEASSTLSTATTDDLNNDPETDRQLKSWWNDLLPYYKSHLSLLGGDNEAKDVFGIPLIAGNQPLLIYRKDLLDSMDLPVPVTWGEYIRVASTLHGQTSLGTNNETTTTTTPIFGSCLGRQTTEICRQEMSRKDLTEDGTARSSCRSMSRTYIGMMLASMTQGTGSSSGWLFDSNSQAKNEMKALIQPTLESILSFMEQQLRFGAPEEMDSDASLNLKLFEEGKCAMTIALDHPRRLLKQSNVGFAPVPGSHTLLDRSSQTIQDCTPERCPYAKPDDRWGYVNQVPFGSEDVMIGTISRYTSKQSADTLQSFFEFIVRVSFGIDASTKREQPLTYRDLKSAGNASYEDIMVALTESENVAAPLRIPNSFNLLSELDNEVYSYLKNGDFSQVQRQLVGERIEASMDRIILQHDTQRQNIPTSVLYEKSLGIFTPTPASDLYIGRATRIVGWSMGGFSCFCSLYFAFWVWRNKGSTVVQASQTRFLNMICIGTFLMAGCIFLFGVEDDFASQRAADKSCMGSMWLYSIGYVLIVSALASKILLINRIFRKAKNMQRIKVDWADILRPLLVLGCINFIILLTWNIQDPVVWERASLSEPRTTLNLEEIGTHGHCNSEYYRVYFGMMVGINYVFSLLSLVQAYECRKISTDYLESSWISASLICIIQVWTICLPLLKLLDDEPRAVFIVKVLVVFLTTMCPLLLIFIPKIRYLREPQAWSALGFDASPTVIHGDHSITSNASDESPTKDRMGNFPESARIDHSARSDHKGKDFHHHKHTLTPLEGIRIIHVSNRHGEEVDKLQRSLRHAEARNQSLNERLERLHEKLEHHILSRHPNEDLHGSASSSNFILSARTGQLNQSHMTK